MKVDLHGLKKSLYLPWRKALGLHRGLTDGCGTEGGDGLHVLHHHRTARNRHLAIVI